MMISIVSEMDTRVVLYPLMKACSIYGSVLVISNDKFIKRMIDDQEFSTFRNIVIVVDEASTADDICQAYSIDYTEYDYVLLDNVSAVEYDKCICLTSDGMSELYAENIDSLKQMGDSSNLFFINYGKPVNAAKEKAKPVKPKKKEAVEEGSGDIPEDYDPERKFRDKVVEEKKKEAKEYTAALPSFAMIEKLEGNRQFEGVDDNLCQVFFDVIGNELGIEYRVFKKEVKANESGSGVKSKRAGR